MLVHTRVCGVKRYICDLRKGADNSCCFARTARCRCLPASLASPNDERFVWTSRIAFWIATSVEEFASPVRAGARRGGRAERTARRCARACAVWNAMSAPQGSERFMLLCENGKVSMFATSMASPNDEKHVWTSCIAFWIASKSSHRLWEQERTTVTNKMNYMSVYMSICSVKCLHSPRDGGQSMLPCEDGTVSMFAE